LITFAAYGVACWRVALKVLQMPLNLFSNLLDGTYIIGTARYFLVFVKGTAGQCNCKASENY